MFDISLEKNYLLLWLSSTLLQRRFQLCIGSLRAIEGNCTLCKCFELLCLFIWTYTICHCHFIICTSLWKWFYLVRGNWEKSQAVSVLDAESKSESVFWELIGLPVTIWRRVRVASTREQPLQHVDAGKKPFLNLSFKTAPVVNNIRQIGIKRLAVLKPSYLLKI